MSAGAEGGCSRFNEPLVYRRGFGARIAAAGPAFFFFLIKKKSIIYCDDYFLGAGRPPAAHPRGAAQRSPRGAALTIATSLRSA